MVIASYSYMCIRFENPILATLFLCGKTTFLLNKVIQKIPVCYMVCIAIWYNNVVMIPEHSTDDYKNYMNY